MLACPNAAKKTSRIGSRRLEVRRKWQRFQQSTAKLPLSSGGGKIPYQTSTVPVSEQRRRRRPGLAAVATSHDMIKNAPASSNMRHAQVRTATGKAGMENRFDWFSFPFLFPRTFPEPQHSTFQLAPRGNKKWKIEIIRRE